MDSTTRDRLRAKQDKLLAVWDSLYPDAMFITRDPGAPTVGDLRQHLFPEWETTIDAFLSREA